MNGGQLPAMEDVPESAHHLIDPAFTVGLGGLTESEADGLRCPVRECGKWFHNLAYHVATTHRGLGGTSALRRALSIPHGAGLVSQALRAKRVATGLTLVEHCKRMQRSGNRSVSREAATRGTRRMAQSKLSVGAKNLRDSCLAQLTHRVIDLAHRVGTSPTYAEALDAFGYPIMHQITQTFGSWTSAKEQCGLKVYKKGRKPIGRDAVLEALTAWYEAHGSLPRLVDAEGRTNKTPYIPAAPTIIRALGATMLPRGRQWPEAMRRAASLLAIYGGRYGLPIEHKPALALA